MTIKELIEELTKYNEELEVLLEVKGADDVGVEPRIVLTHRKGGRSCVLLKSGRGVYASRNTCRLGMIRPDQNLRSLTWRMCLVDLLL